MFNLTHIKQTAATIFKFHAGKCKTATFLLTLKTSVMLKVCLNHFGSSTNKTAWSVHILSTLTMSKNGINFLILIAYFTVLSKLL